MAFNQVAYEGVAEQQVKTGGYGAEFGRSLGGVISVTTKRGTNEWTGGVNLKHNNSALGAKSIYTKRNETTAEWETYERPGGRTDTSLNTWVGGPIIKDKLFIFWPDSPQASTLIPTLQIRRRKSEFNAAIPVEARLERHRQQLPGGYSIQ